MIKYLAISTVIVVGAAVLATAWVNRDLIRVKIASVYKHGSAKSGFTGGANAPTPARLLGDAPWILSALPGCLTQISVSKGPPAYVRAHLPLGAAPVAPHATLTYGDCSIMISGDEAYVRRGVDYLRIPPRAQFYRAGDLLALVRESSEGTELRVYEPAKQ
ncbi:MAG TPA: hypothetical protein VEW74_03300 [Candidatus Nitrosotalea sp.]|nr:hypothetical protein [Candidatus Nitrosotalea sp.]